MIPTLRTGDTAVYDTFSGLVSVKVTRITGKSGRCGSDQQVEFEVERDYFMRPDSIRPVYRKGEKLEAWGLHVVPRAALKSGRFDTRIGPYNVEVSHE